MNEGRVLEEKFRRKIGALGEEPETVVFTQNKDTKEDLYESLRLILKKGLRRVAIITVGVHIRRSLELFNLFREDEKPPDDLKADFLSSEEVLSQASEKYKRRFKLVKRTAAFRRTVASERKKIKILRTKGYKFTERIIE